MNAPTPDREIVIQAAADLHGELPEIPTCDLLLLVGDLVPYDREDDAALTRDWFGGEFAEWVDRAPAGEVIAIAGNHDFWAPEVPEGSHVGLFGADWTYLRDAEMTTRSGLRVYGSPWTRDVYGTAFEAPAPELERLWSGIPTGLDILMVHSPPLGYGDTLVEEGGEPTRMGAPELVTAIRRASPRLVVFGHAHEAYGYRAEEPHGTVLANVTIRTDYVGGLGRPTPLLLAPAAGQRAPRSR